MTRISGYLVELRDNTVDAEGLVAQLPGFEHLPGGIRKVRRVPHESKRRCGHIPALTVLAHDLPQCVGGLFQHYDFLALLVLAELFVLGLQAGAQHQRIALGVHLVDGLALAHGLVGQRHLGRFGSGHRGADDVALHQPVPLPGVVQRMNDLQLILAVERFLHQRRRWQDSAQTVAGEISAVRGIDTKHGVYLLVMGKRKAPHERRHVVNTLYTGMRPSTEYYTSS